MSTNDEPIHDTDIPIFNDWEQYNLPTALLRGIYSYGFEKPSPVQSKAIYPMLQGRDLIAQAQSGTGKTGAFTIGAISKVNTNESTNQVLILVPTHELAHQVVSVIQSLTSMMPELRVKTIVGGSSIKQDAQDMKNNVPHILVGCPGRVYDLIRRNHIDAQQLKLVIMDEADEMLSFGFKEQVKQIFSCISQTAQVALFSATLPENIRQITDQFMNNPLHISVKAESLTLEGIKQYFVAVRDDHDKFDTIKDLYSRFTLSQCIIYVNSVHRVINLRDALNEQGFPVCCIHSNMSKPDREKAFSEFKSGACRVLISSNVTARGIDIQQVGIVINFDVPNDVHTYLHRIGRSGRWGRKGTGINFITKRDVTKMREIEHYYSTQIDELPNDFAC